MSEKFGTPPMLKPHEWKELREQIREEFKRKFGDRLREILSEVVIEAYKEGFKDGWNYALGGCSKLTKPEPSYGK